MLNKTITFFVNGNNIIGFGHISRCLILAKEFNKKGYKILFVTPYECTLKDKIEIDYDLFQVNDFNDTKIEKIPSNFRKNALIDVIESDFLSLKKLKTKKLFDKVLSITLFDFDHKIRYEDITFFPSFELNKIKEIPSINGVTLQYIGKDYLTFGNTKPQTNSIQNKSRNELLITMGGADPENLTLKILNSLKDIEIKIKVVLNKKAKSYEEVSFLCSTRKNINLVEFIPNLSNTFSQYKLIVINGGLTRYEAILERVPFVAISINEKQYLISEKVCKLGIGLNLGVGNRLKNEEIQSEIINLFNNDNLLNEMHLLSEGLLDSKGSQRIINIINNNIYNEKINAL